MRCLGSLRPLQQSAALLHSSTVLREHGGKDGDSHAKGSDGKGASSMKASKTVLPRSVSMTEKDKPDPVDLVS